jgi:hypothetical protein
MTALINADTSSGVVITSDTSGSLALQSAGTTQLTVASTGAYGQLKSGTAQASTSGTNIDFTSIPSWVKRITVVFNEVSTTGSAIVLVQLGTGGTPTTSGYLSTKTEISTSGNTASYTTGHGVVSGSASNVASGQVVFTNVSGNIWIGTGSIKQSTTFLSFSNSSVTLGGVLNFVRITCSGDTFDAGSINILYEG